MGFACLVPEATALIGLGLLDKYWCTTVECMGGGWVDGWVYACRCVVVVVVVPVVVVVIAVVV